MSHFTRFEGSIAQEEDGPGHPSVVSKKSLILERPRTAHRHTVADESTVYPKTAQWCAPLDRKNERSKKTFRHAPAEIDNNIRPETAMRRSAFARDVLSAEFAGGLAFGLSSAEQRGTSVMNVSSGQESKGSDMSSIRSAAQRNNLALSISGKESIGRVQVIDNQISLESHYIGRGHTTADEIGSVMGHCSIISNSWDCISVET